MSVATDFDRFWKAWPANSGRYSRKGGKSACLAVWNKRYHFTQADTIIKHVEWLKTTADWLKDQGAYIPAPLVYLNQRRWDGADIPAAFEAIDEQKAVINSRQWIADHAAHAAKPQDEAKVREAIDRMKAARKSIVGKL